jgi:hypothetical protein
MIQTHHQTIQLVGAKGGVYRGQGRSQRDLMAHVYWAFLIEDQQLQ